MTISLYEDNGGGLHIQREGDDFLFTNMEQAYFTGGSIGFADDAESIDHWASDWQDRANADEMLVNLGPNGVVPNGIAHIATWQDGAVTLERDAENIGFNGRKYLGIDD
jgi:hypothetical protein